MIAAYTTVLVKLVIENSIMEPVLGKHGYKGAARSIPSGPKAAHQAAIEEARMSHTGSLFVLYLGSVDESTGRSWCPDCTNSLPSLVKGLNSVDGCMILECQIDRADWKNKDEPHFLRKNKWGHVSGVPALIKIGTTARPVGLLVEDEIMDESLMQSLLTL